MKGSLILWSFAIDQGNSIFPVVSRISNDNLSFLFLPLPTSPPLVTNTWITDYLRTTSGTAGLKMLGRNAPKQSWRSRRKCAGDGCVGGQHMQSGVPLWRLDNHQRECERHRAHHGLLANHDRLVLWEVHHRGGSHSQADWPDSRGWAACQPTVPACAPLANWGREARTHFSSPLLKLLKLAMFRTVKTYLCSGFVQEAGPQNVNCHSPH